MILAVHLKKTQMLNLILKLKPKKYGKTSPKLRLKGPQGPLIAEEPGNSGREKVNTGPSKIPSINLTISRFNIAN